MTITCPVLDHAEFIPSQYTCDGSKTIPPLEFGDVPQHTQSLALIMRDPDAPHGEFTHWLLWNISPATHAIEEGEMPVAVVGTNDAGSTDYFGPCPPHGVHHYYFDLYALDTELDLEAEATRQELDHAMASHIIATATTVGLYQKR